MTEVAAVTTGALEVDVCREDREGVMAWLRREIGALNGADPAVRDHRRHHALIARLRAMGGQP